MSDGSNPAADAEAFAEALDYVLLLEQFESLRVELEVAIAFEDRELAEEIAPKLAAANKAIRAAHAQFFPRVQAEIDALTGRVN
ncbi:MAG TPA: hypothetical protein VNK23_12125 [Candidatus Dormibacteraeota bacterium]|nr:hypothetical protein [Candidatus Dormibacteraeota bacterium]